jgi:protease secretion system membrane fusion protein
MNKSEEQLPVSDVTPRQWSDMAQTQGPIRLGFWILVMGFGLTLAWAAWAPLDQGVPAPGTVSIETRRKTIQHPTGGVVKSVMVKEGQWVSVGAVLMEIDNTAAGANYDTARQTYWSQRAVESRLLAEQQGAAQIRFHPELQQAQADAFVQQVMASQQALFIARRAAWAAEMGALQENLESIKLQQSALDLAVSSKIMQSQLQDRHLQSVRALSAEGYAPRNQVLQMEQAQVELRSNLSDMQSNQSRLVRTLAEARFRLEQQRQNYLKDVSAQMADVRKDIQLGQERLAVAQQELSRTAIVSPVEGQVVGMAISATGGVVLAGQKLMEVVPKGEDLLIDAKVPTHIIDKVMAGQDVDIRFSGFANTPQLVVPGKIVTLSSDAISDPSQAAPAGMSNYYLARVEITPEGHRVLGDRVVRPGMPTEVLIKVGQRSVLQYLVHPLLKRVAASMKEE